MSREPADGFAEEEHPTDALFRITGASREELFVNAARACFALMTDLESVRPVVVRRIACDGGDREELLIAWLNELIGVCGTENLFFCRFAIRELTDTQLAADAYGEPIDSARHPLKKEVKAATLHRLSIRQTDVGWEGTVLFDL